MNTTNKPRYTVVIQWSDEDERYVVSLPEWGGPKTHGDTYEEAARNAREVLELLMEDENGRPVNLPPPHLFHYPGAGVVDLPEDAVNELHASVSNESPQVHKIA